MRTIHDCLSELSGEELRILEDLKRDTDVELIENYMQEAEDHLRGIRAAVGEGDTADIETADAIYNVFLKIENDWDSFSEEQKLWLCIAIRYFASDSDELSDVDSGIGFEDDLAILGAILGFAGRKDLRKSAESAAAQL